jgi:hypothetical protein
MVVPASLDSSAFVGDQGPLPVTPPTGRGMPTGIIVRPPTAAGIHTFAAGSTADKAAPSFTVGQTTLRAYSASLNREGMPLPRDAGGRLGESSCGDLP